MEIAIALLLVLVRMQTRIDRRGAPVLARWWRMVRVRVFALLVLVPLASVALWPFLGNGDFASADFGWFLARGYGTMAMYGFSWWLFHRKKFDRKRKAK